MDNLFDKEHLLKENNLAEIGDLFIKRFSKAFNLLSDIFPEYATADTQLASEINDLIKDVDKFNIPTCQIKLSFLEIKGHPCICALVLKCVFFFS